MPKDKKKIKNNNILFPVLKFWASSFVNGSILIIMKNIYNLNQEDLRIKQRKL